MKMDTYDSASVMAGLTFLGDNTEDPEWERRADLVLALRSIHRTRAIACVLYAQGYTTTEIGKYFVASQSVGAKLLRAGLIDLKERMNAQTCVA